MAFRVPYKFVGKIKMKWMSAYNLIGIIQLKTKDQYFNMCYSIRHPFFAT